MCVMVDLRQTLHQFQTNNYLCDTELVAEDGCVKAHAVVLAAASSVFKDALKPGSKPEERIIVLPGIEVYLLEIAVSYAYTGEIMVPKQYMNTEHLAVVINVLTELGFELSAVITSVRDGDDKSSDLNTERKSQHDVHESVACDSDSINGNEDIENSKETTGMMYEDTVAADPKEEVHRSLDHIYCGFKSLGNIERAQNHRQSQICNKMTSSSAERKVMTQSVLNRTSHSKRVSNAKPLKATNEVKRSAILEDMQSAGRGHSNEPNSNLCDVCGEIFDDFQTYRTHKLRFHRRRKKELPVQCQLCGASFANRPNLRRHMYQHTGERPHLCQHCGEGFIQRKSLQDHVTSRHPDKIDRDPSVVPYECRKCGEKLYNSYAYRRHVKVECELRHGANHSKKVPRTHSDNESKPYACDKCGRRFALQASVIIHSRLHTDEWAVHMGRQGTRYRGTKCDHMCRTCGKKFNFRATLVAHERIHTGEKPFKCTFCGLALATACQLHAHLLRHTGEMPHTCGVCGKGFRLRANLLSHERTHTGEKPFTCPNCGRQLAHAAQLIDHMRIHTGEKPYKCKICGKQMRQRAHLTTHMRTHTGERPYRCQLCEKSYKQVADLRFHYRRMHQFELPKNPDRRPLCYEAKALNNTEEQVVK